MCEIKYFRIQEQGGDLIKQVNFYMPYEGSDNTISVFRDWLENVIKSKIVDPEDLFTFNLNGNSTWKMEVGFSSSCVQRLMKYEQKYLEVIHTYGPTDVITEADLSLAMNCENCKIAIHNWFAGFYKVKCPHKFISMLDKLGDDYIDDLWLSPSDSSESDSSESDSSESDLSDYASMDDDLYECDN